MQFLPYLFEILGFLVLCVFAVIKQTGLSPLAQIAMTASGFGLWQCGRVAQNVNGLAAYLQLFAMAGLLLLLAYEAWTTRERRLAAERI